LVVALAEQAHQVPAGVQAKGTRRARQTHARFFRRAAALAIVAGVAAGHQILPRGFARTRAREKHGIEVLPERIFVLGDTPHDISCGHAIGAKAKDSAIGIASNAVPRERNRLAFSIAFLLVESGVQVRAGCDDWTTRRAAHLRK